MPAAWVGGAGSSPVAAIATSTNVVHTRTYAHVGAHFFAQADADHSECAVEAAKQHNSNTTTMLYEWPRTSLLASLEPLM